MTAGDQIPTRPWPSVRAAAKYEIPAHHLEMVAKYAESCGTVLYRGVYVDTKCGGQTWPAEEGICALCEGTGTVPCAECDGDGVLVAETPTPVWDEDDERHYDEYQETACSGCKGKGRFECPQSRATWCHEN